MKNRSRVLAAVITAIALPAAPQVSAQEGLIEIYTRALTNDPALRQAEAEYMATAETKPQARSSLLPNLTLGASADSRFTESSQSVGFGNLTLGSGSETRNSSDGVDLSLSQTLIDFSSLRTLKQADKTIARAETDLAAARQDLLVRVADAYFNVLAAEDTLAAEEAARESISRQLEQAQRRFEVGLIAITDVQEAQAGFDTAVAAVIAAERALATSREFLREIINDYVPDLESPGDALTLVSPEPNNVEAWVRISQQQNLALASSRIGADIAQDDIEILRAARLPTLDLSAGVNTGSSNNRFTTINVDGTRERTPRAGDSDGLSWALNFRMPLYTGGMNRSRIQQSVYRHRAALEAVELVARQTERQTRDAYLGVIAEISRVRALRQAVESSQTALRATEAGFEVGTRTTVDVLNSQNNLRQAQTTYARSRYDYILNVLRLKQAAGNLSVEDLRQVDGWLE